MDQLEIIETLKHMPNALEAEVAGIITPVLGFKPSDDAWSIKEVVGHLSFADVIWYKRLYMVWSQTDPVLMSFDGEAKALEAARGMQDIKPLLAAIRESRPNIVDLLSHAVDWTRIGQWRGEGRRSLKQLAEYLVSHDAEHLSQVRELKAAAGTRASI
jgi:DinB superfamily